MSTLPYTWHRDAHTCMHASENINLLSAYRAETHTQPASRNILSTNRLPGNMETCDIVEWRLFISVNCEWAICEDNFKRKSCSLSFPRQQTLVNPQRRRFMALSEFFVIPGMYFSEAACKGRHQSSCFTWWWGKTRKWWLSIYQSIMHPVRKKRSGCPWDVWKTSPPREPSIGLVLT